MKSFTRIGLPLLIVVGAVFGITFIRIYSPDDPSTAPVAKGPGSGTGKKASLFFPVTEVAPPSTLPDGGRKFLSLWSGEYEVGSPGHFDFWAVNNNPDPVTVRVFDVNCQCAGVDVAVVEPEAYREYAAVSALADGPLGAGPLAAVAHATLASRLKWAPLLDRDNPDEKPDRTIPAADSRGPQFAVVRLQWKAKTEPGPKEVNTQLLAWVGSEQPSRHRLAANTVAVPAFELVRRVGPGSWQPGNEVSFGDLHENGEARRAVYLFSGTRSAPVYSVSSDRPDPCISWSDPAPASAEEIRSLTEYLADPGRAARQSKSLYRVEITVRERAETQEDGKTVRHQLDLGPLDRRLTIRAADGGSMSVPIHGRVLGDVSFLSGSADGRIDLGNAIPANQEFVKDAVLVAERAGVDLAAVAGETRPNYLQVKLEPLEKVEGRNRWRLRITIPKGSLLGALPPDSSVVLTTSGPHPRRFRIPVRGMTYDSGEPRF